jgi:hypothetical protein
MMKFTFPTPQAVMMASINADEDEASRYYHELLSLVQQSHGEPFEYNCKDMPDRPGAKKLLLDALAEHGWGAELSFNKREGPFYWILPKQ